jgi:hypothetical protein
VLRKILKAKNGVFILALPALIVLVVAVYVSSANSSVNDVQSAKSASQEDVKIAKSATNGAGDIEIIETDPDDPYVAAPLVDGDEFSEFTKPVREMQINILRIESGWDSQTKGLPEPLAGVKNKEHYYDVQPLFKSGIIGIDGSVYTGKIVIYLDDLSYKEPIAQKVYNGLTAEEIASIPDGLLTFSLPENGAHISDLADALDAVEEKDAEIQEIASKNAHLQEPASYMFGVDAKSCTVKVSISKDAPAYQKEGFEQLKGRFITIEEDEFGGFTTAASGYAS